jgi:type III restriction enzyme
MSNPFFDRPILNSPYEYPRRHWELDEAGKRLLDHLAAANKDANPELMRLALKLATGAGKTTVMAMLIAWQTVNAVRRPASTSFTRGFLVCAPGLTIKDRLRVLQPNDPDSYYASREIVPNDMLGDPKTVERSVRQP